MSCDAMTVKRLREKLATLPDDMFVHVEDNQHRVFIIDSTVVLNLHIATASNHSLYQKILVLKE